MVDGGVVPSQKPRKNHGLQNLGSDDKLEVILRNNFYFRQANDALKIYGSDPSLL